MTDTTQHDPRDEELAALLPCPFCGGAVKLEEAHIQRTAQFGDRQFYGVVCRNTTNLGGTCCMEQVPSASKEAAIERWNRRPQFVAQQARIAQMRDGLLHYSDIRPDTLGRTVVLSEEGAVARNALATTDDLSALKAHDYALIEKCAEYAGSLNLTITSGEQKISLPKISQYIAVAIRSLKR